MGKIEVHPMSTYISPEVVTAQITEDLEESNVHGVIALVLKENSNGTLTYEPKWSTMDKEVLAFAARTLQLSIEAMCYKRN